MKFFTGLSFQQWLIIAAGVICLLGYGVYKYQSNELKDIKKEVVVKDITIASQKDTIVTGQKVAKIEEATQVATAVAVKEATVKHEGIKQRVDQKDRAISQRFDELPVTLENLNAEQQQLSENRINGLWEAFCAGSPDAKGCEVTPSPAGEAHV